MQLYLQLYVVFGSIGVVIHLKAPCSHPDDFVGRTESMRGIAVGLFYSIFDFPLPQQQSTIAP
jgi:hypothetical protein